MTRALMLLLVAAMMPRGGSEGEMLDLIYTGVTVGFFLIAIAYVRACERLR